MNTLHVEDNTLIWSYNGQTLTLIAWGKDSLRVRASLTGDRPRDECWALLPAVDVTPVFIQNEHSITMVNGKICATVDRQGRVQFHNQAGRLLLAEMWRQRDNGEKFWDDGFNKTISALKISGREFKPLAGDVYRISVRFEPHPEEKLYGMGQYQQPFLDLKGSTLELAQRNSQASVPFVVSNQGYGFLWNNPAVGEASFAKNGTRWVADAARQIDYWITAGDTPAAIVENYVGATGKPPLMPDFALGLWQSKLRYRTQDELLSVAREYQRRGIPLAVIVADFFHWPIQGDWRFDVREWPDPQSMIAELKAMGTELMVSVWPTVDIRSENYVEMNQKGYLVNSNKGLNINFDFLGNTRFIDATHPGARQFLWQALKRNYFDQGVRLFWLDEAEPEYGVYDFENYRYHIGNTLETGNIYPLCYTQAVFEGQQAAGVAAPVSLVRCAWAGSQRYGALVWSGDIHSSFASMRNQLCAGLNMGMAGISWWTTDIGGFHGGNIADPQFHELLIRWFQWAVFCPVLRMHGHREPITEPLIPWRDGIAQCNTGAGNELWSFGEATYTIVRRYAALRETLKPYLTMLMSQAHETGAPLMRPMFYEFPAQPECWQCEDQYMFGADILVAPILDAGQTYRQVYLPGGQDWIDPWTAKQWPGGTTITAEAPLNIIPVFIKAGANVLDLFNL